MSKYDHIIWDWNGTLIDDTWLCVEIMDSELKKLGKGGLTFDQYRMKFIFPVVDFYESIGFDFSNKPYEDFAKLFIDTYGSRRFECDLHFGVKALLNKTSGLGMKHSVLSAYSQDVLIEAIEHYGILDSFENIKGLNDHFAGGKINEGLDLIKKVDTDKSRVVLIGDTFHDYEVAKAMGIDSILVMNGHQNDMILSRADVPVVRSISEALTHIF
jgi:phosphoglycolate phosphatase